MLTKLQYFTANLKRIHVGTNLKELFKANENLCN